MIELRIRDGPIGPERIFRINPEYIDGDEFTAFLDEIPDRDGPSAYLLEYNGRQKHIGRGDINTIRRVIADPSYLEHRKVLKAKKLILDLLERRGEMRIESLSAELGFSHDTITKAVEALTGRKGYLEFTDVDTVKHRFAEVA